MKYNQLAYNLEGVFRFLRGAEAVDRALSKVPAVHQLFRTMNKRRLEGARWRRMGLLTDDLIIEEHDVTQEALRRIPKDQLHGRYARAKVALHYDMLRRELPRDKWVTAEQDQHYLLPHIRQILSEYEEREFYDNGNFVRSSSSSSAH